MNDLRQQILDLFQNWYEENFPVDWASYEFYLRKANELLTKIYTLVKNYKEDSQNE